MSCVSANTNRFDTMPSVVPGTNPNCDDGTSNTKKGSAPNRTDTPDTVIASNDNTSTNDDGEYDTIDETATFLEQYKNLTDEELIKKAEDEDNNDCILSAGRLLRMVQDKTLLESKQHLQEILDNVKVCTDCVTNLKSSYTLLEEQGWKKQSESHDINRDTIIHYKVDQVSYRLTCRIETPIESSLLVPLLSVFNESELYTTWIPTWTTPVSLGINEVVKLKQDGRARQILQILCDVPWPFTKRQVIINAIPFDDIDKNGIIAIKLQTLPNGSKNGLIQPPPTFTTRVDFDGGILFRKCPVNHPCLQNSRVQYPTDEHLLLVSFEMCIDPKLKFIPTTIINFITRTVISTIWSRLLKVAEDIRSGKRPQHEQAIEQKRKQIYDWIEERIGALFTRLQQEEGNQQEQPMK